MAEKLSEEILCHIFSYLQPVGGQVSQASEDQLKLGTLISASLASRTCHRIARPFIYARLDLWCPGISRLRPLLSTLIAHPKTSHLVKSLHLQAWETQADRDANHSIVGPAASSVVDSFLGAAGRCAFQPALWERLQAGLRAGLQDAEVTLLVALCRNLELLSFEAVHKAEQTLFMHFLQDAMVAKSPSIVDGSILVNNFDFLSQVCVSHWDTENTTQMSVVATLLELPALTYFNGRMLECTEEFPYHLSKPSRVKAASLENCLVDGAGLHLLLEACPQLETLHVHWGGSTVGVTELDYSDLGDTLRHHGQSLQKLTLDPTEAFSVEDDEGLSRLGDLTPLNALKLLTVTGKMLYGDIDEDEDEDEDDNDDGASIPTSSRYLIEILPHSVQTLKITDDDYGSDEDFDEQIWALIQDQEFSSLRSIRVRRAEPFSKPVQDVGWKCVPNKFWMILKKDP